ncbi:MAG: ATP-binding cassette domain-containing protein [Ornithinibacter sp.]
MITVDNLTKKYAGVVLDDFTWEFSRSSVTAVVGPNGTGKTTLFKCVLGLERYHGTILFDGRPLEEVRDRVVSVFDDAPLYTHLSGRDNLRYFLPDRAVSARGHYADLLVGPDGRWLQQRVGSMSHGQRKRLAVLIALGSDPLYVVLDEVSNGIDVLALDGLAAAVAEISSVATVIVSGHDLGFLATMAQRSVAIVDGVAHEVARPGSQFTLEQEYRRVYG